MLICGYRVLEQEVKEKVNDRFDEEQDLSQVSIDGQNFGVELTSRQSEIYRNLESIGPEIAAFYKSGIQILQVDGLEIASYLLAHIAREIDGGLRDILSSGASKEHIQTQLTEEVLTKLGNYDEIKNRKGHIASILEALGIDDTRILFSLDDARTRYAISWVNVATQFHKFAHRQGAWRSPRNKDEFENLWYEFEGILEYLIGNNINLLNRIDRILEYQEPTVEIRATLHNLLGSEERRAYFFRKLGFLSWLEPLKEDGWFNPQNNPKPQEDLDQPGVFRIPTWHALEYVAKVSDHPGGPVNVLVDIANSIISYIDDTGERIDNGRTDLQTIKIIGTFPIDHLESQHITFMDIALKSKWKYGLVDQEIGQIILPKLLSGGNQELTLMLLKIMLEAKIVDGRILSTMNEYWLEEVLKKQGQNIANLCGIEAAQISLAQIRKLADIDAFAFDFIQLVEGDLSLLSHADYTELVVSFTSCLFQFAEPDSIEETVQVLLNDPHTIIRRIAVKTINQHYSDLKRLFWNWVGNPLDEIELKPEMYQLIKSNSLSFDEDEMEQILQWIESTQY